MCMSGKRQFETWIFIKMKKFFGLNLNLKSLSITLNPHFFIYTNCKVQVEWCRYWCVCRPVDVTWMHGPPPCLPGSETGSCFCRRTWRLLFPSLQKHLARTKQINVGPRSLTVALCGTSRSAALPLSLVTTKQVISWVPAQPKLWELIKLPLSTDKGHRGDQ